MVAAGVKFSRMDQRDIRNTRKEDFLYARVFQSPKVLELSGTSLPKLL